MKVFDSGMPEEAYWNSLFDIPKIIEWLDLDNIKGPIAEIGCGYGTFTIPMAQATTEKIYTFDIEGEMIDIAKKNAHSAGVKNIDFFLRDVIEQGTGLAERSCGLVLLFNILHFAERRILLAEAARILQPGGVAAIIHWRKDIETPRGPAMDSRPDRGIILDSIAGLDLTFAGEDRILEPYHWGAKLRLQ